MAEKIAGTAFVKVDGDQLTLSGTLKVDPSEFEREGMVGLSGVAGFNEKNVIPEVEIEIFVTSQTDLTKLKDLVDGSVTVELANGKVFVLRNAWLASRLPIDGAEGKLPIKFQGQKMEESQGAAV